MATPSANHYMRQYTTEQLRTIVGDPRHYGVGERLDADAILRERGTYDPAMRGRRAVTRYGETGCITGPASDPARCTFRPDGEAGVVESITPRIAHLTYLDDTPHVGHFTLWGTWYCDTCESPYCDLA